MRKFHPIIATIAFLTILTFWASTIITELVGDTNLITMVKLCILYGMLILIPSMALSGISGFRLHGSRQSRILTKKATRMKIIAANGICILVPAAFFLYHKAQHHNLDTSFWIIQIIELLAGATNITLMTLNIKDGFKLTGRFK